jgi:ketosteroid isomerase-like protein
MNRLIRVASASMALAWCSQSAPAADAASDATESPAVSPTDKACGPSVTAGLSTAQLLKMNEATRAVALKFFKSTPDEQDKLLTPNAYIWSVGIGEIDRTRYGELHKPRPGRPDHGKPSARKQTFNYVTVDGDRAAVDMENYAVFKDFTYDQKYHNLVIVRDGKVCALKIYSDVEQAKQLVPDITNYVKPK